MSEHVCIIVSKTGRQMIGRTSSIDLGEPMEVFEPMGIGERQSKSGSVSFGMGPLMPFYVTSIRINAEECIVLEESSSSQKRLIDGYNDSIKQVRAQDSGIVLAGTGTIPSNLKIV